MISLCFSFVLITSKFLNLLDRLHPNLSYFLCFMINYNVKNINHDLQLPINKRVLFFKIKYCYKIYHGILFAECYFYKHIYVIKSYFLLET